MSPAVRPNFASRPGERLDQVLADEVDLGFRLRLRVGDHHDVERFRLVLALKRKVERGRQRPGRRDALEAEIERGRRAHRLMMAIEARQVGRRIDRRHEARRLDDEDRRLVRQRQRVAAVGVGRPRRRGRSRRGRRRARDWRRSARPDPSRSSNTRPGHGRAFCASAAPGIDRRQRQARPPRRSATSRRVIPFPSFDMGKLRITSHGIRQCGRDARVKGANRQRTNTRGGILEGGKLLRVDQSRSSASTIARSAGRASWIVFQTRSSCTRS